MFEQDLHGYILGFDLKKNNLEFDLFELVQYKFVLEYNFLFVLFPYNFDLGCKFQLVSVQYKFVLE